MGRAERPNKRLGKVCVFRSYDSRGGLVTVEYEDGKSAVWPAAALRLPPEDEEEVEEEEEANDEGETLHTEL